MHSSFVEEFNRLLADAIYEALLADQGMDASGRRRRGSRRAFEPVPPLFLPAPQLLEGIVQVGTAAAALCDAEIIVAPFDSTSPSTRA